MKIKKKNNSFIINLNKIKSFRDIQHQKQLLNLALEVEELKLTNKLNLWLPWQLSVFVGQWIAKKFL